MVGGKTIGKSFDYGFAGSYARQPDMIINTRPNNGTDNIVFGSPLMVSGDGVKNVDGTLTAAAFVGVAGKEVKSALSYADQNSGGEYQPGEAVSTFQRGSISVICPYDSPARYSPVYIRTVAVSPRKIGDFEVAADGTNNILIPNAQWNGEKDANNVAELVLLTRETA